MGIPNLADLQMFNSNTSEMPTDLPWQLLEEITNGFSEERKIGSGGYGVVYKGVYKNGEEIAVKKLYHMPALDDKQFQNEFQTLTRLHHQNIVRLVGQSYEEKERFGEYQGKLVCAKMIDRVICLEYLHNGSLEKHLSDESSGLPWHKRYKIIKGICDGLKYLHEYGIFHLDLKPANILLDENMEPKIADFGLSRVFSGPDQSHTTRNFIGTLGYVPPEYIEKGKISNKFDVFSLGVIIIGIMTGPDGYSRQSDMSSQDFIKQVLENWRNRPQEQRRVESYFDVSCQLKICIEIALSCVKADRHRRPSIGDIISTLNVSEMMIDKSYKGMYNVDYCARDDPILSLSLEKQHQRQEKGLSGKLAFRNRPVIPIFTGSKIKDANGDALQIIIVDVDTDLPLALPQPLRIELVPLMGDFPREYREEWSADEFTRGIMKERDGMGPLLTGDVNLTMRDGCVTVNELQFTDNSSWVRCRRFRIGVRVAPGSYDGVRIREAMSEAFMVRDHRGELYRKHYPPLLGDDVWRLEKIPKDGAFHRKLTHHNVRSVREFLCMLMVKPDELRTILGGGMTDRMWEATTTHAKTCIPGDKVYVCSGEHSTIYVNSICQLVKIEFGGVECTLQQLNRAQRIYVQQLLLQAHEQRNNLLEADAVMLHGHATNNVPLLQNAAQVELPAPAETPLWFQNNQEIGF